MDSPLYIVDVSSFIPALGNKIPVKVFSFYEFALSFASAVSSMIGRPVEDAASLVITVDPKQITWVSYLDTVDASQDAYPYSVPKTTKEDCECPKST